MGGSRGSLPAESFRGMAVLSLATGNRLGLVDDLFLFPQNGTLSGVSIASQGGLMFAPFNAIHSFGRDAIVLQDERFAAPIAAFENSGRALRRILGAGVVSDAGDVLGRISRVHVTLEPPPAAIFEVAKSFLHKIFGRSIYLPASAGRALSDDSQRLLISAAAARSGVRDIRDLLEQGITVRSFEGDAVQAGDDFEDETVVRMPVDDDETVVRMRDDDETVVRLPRKAG
jgi:uncharacterized protein YrrD